MAFRAVLTVGITKILMLILIRVTFNRPPVWFKFSTRQSQRLPSGLWRKSFGNPELSFVVDVKKWKISGAVTEHSDLKVYVYLFAACEK